MEYVERSTKQHATERYPRLTQQGRGTRLPRAYTFQMPSNSSRSPWIVRQAERGILRPPRSSSSQPSSVAEPLSHRAQLAAGMLPLRKPTEQIPAQPSAALVAPTTSAPTRPASPPMTLPSSETTHLDLSCKQETTPGQPSLRASPITSDEEDVPDLVENSTSFSPVINKVETISVTEYKNMPAGEPVDGPKIPFQ